MIRRRCVPCASQVTGSHEGQIVCMEWAIKSGGKEKLYVAGIHLLPEDGGWGDWFIQREREE